MRLEDAEIGRRVRLILDPNDPENGKEGTIMRIGGPTDGDFDKWWAKLFPIEVSIDGTDYTDPVMYRGSDGVQMWSTFKPEELEAI